jgi:hypothetical protein
MLLPGCVVHVSGYGIKLFRVRICVCARSYMLWNESEECDAGRCTCSACKIKNNNNF